MLIVPEPSAPDCVEAIMAMRQVVMESARGMEMLALPFPSVMISGLVQRSPVSVVISKCDGVGIAVGSLVFFASMD